MALIDRLVANRHRRIAKAVMGLYGLEIPADVKIGRGVVFEHHGFGTVLHPHTTIGDRVQIFHGVTIGDSAPWPGTPGAVGRVVVEDDVTLGAGAKILVARDSTLTIGRGSVVGANAVVTKSIPPGEIWAGSPARKVAQRDSVDASGVV